MSYKSLPNKATNASGASRSKPLQDSVSFLAQLIHVKEGDPSKSNPKMKKPGLIAVIPGADVSIPYIFREPHVSKGQTQSKNTITSPLKPEDAPPLIVKAGEKTLLIQMFNPPNLKIGMIYRVEGVYQDAFQGYVTNAETGEEVFMEKPALRLSCTSLNLTSITVHDFIKEIPFSSRCIDIARDIPGDDKQAHCISPRPYYYFTAVLNGKRDDMTPGQITGAFVELPDGAYPELVYTPHDKETNQDLAPICAITGGSIGGKPRKAQFYLRQVSPDGKNIHVFCTFTRVYYEGGLKDLQLKWENIGEVIVPHIRGLACCTINRYDTAFLSDEDGLTPEEKSMFDGTMVVNTILIPDMNETARSMGVKIKWDTCCLVDQRLNNPSNVVSPNKEYYKNMTAVNILEYSGDCSLLPLFEEKGWIDFILICNMPISQEGLQEMHNSKDEAEFIKSLQQTFKKNYTRTKPYYAIFACPTPSCPTTIDNCVSSTGKPNAIMYLDQTFKHPRVQVE